VKTLNLYNAVVNLQLKAKRSKQFANGNMLAKQLILEDFHPSIYCSICFPKRSDNTRVKIVTKFADDEEISSQDGE
jgi:hypothetical protein